MAEHTVKAFDEDITRLRGLIAEMGGLAEVAVGEAMRALVNGDEELAAADLDPARAFDHPVENDEIGCVLARQQQRLVSVGGGAYSVPFVGEAVFEQFGEGGIVLHQQ